MEDTRVDQIFNYFIKFGDDDYIGEDVSQIEHMTQAAMLAEENNENEEFIVACLLHDIGHLLAKDGVRMGDYGVSNHEKIGSVYLKNLGFSQYVCNLVEGHVTAKRYLTYKNPNYYNKLSDASKTTLKYQGGPMNKEEAIEFEQHPHFSDILKIRSYDETSKVPEKYIYQLEHYRAIINRVLNN